MNNAYIGKKKKRSKGNKNKSGALKTLMQHSKGLPPSCNWSNSFSSIKQGKYLLYIANSYIIVIDTAIKSFEQILSSNKIVGSDKPNILLSLSLTSFLSITDQGLVVIFNQKQRPNNGFIFIEEFNLYANSINMQSADCNAYPREKNNVY